MNNFRKETSTCIMAVIPNNCRIHKQGGEGEGVYISISNCEAHSRKKPIYMYQKHSSNDEFCML